MLKRRAGPVDRTGSMRRTGLAVAAAALALAGCGAAPRPPAALDPGPAGAGDASVLMAQMLKTANFRAAAALAAQRRALIRAEVARLRRSPAVPDALLTAELTGRVTPAGYRRLVGDWGNAQRVLALLAGTRRAELSYVVATVRGLAAQHALTPERVVPMFLILRRNTAFWSRAPNVPPAGWRTTFGGDPAVFQYYPGRGLQLQPLASWGRANAQARACLEGRRCRRARLRRTLDRFSGLAARRAGYIAWEYYFDFGGGAPPWVSGMTQATAIQALARGYRALGARRFRRTALRALRAFELPSPAGVAVPAPGGTAYLMYSFAPTYEILNGDLQAVTGLHDAAALLRSRRAGRLFRRGERAARRAVAAYDTGAWSLYSDAGDESTLSYHELLAGFLHNLCTRTRRRVYCRTAARFVRYEHEPPRIGLAPLPRLRADRPVPLRFSLSKISTVSVRVWSADGVSLATNLRLAHGEHFVDWTPPARGRFRLLIEARGPSGPLGVARRTLDVRLPKPPKRKKRAARLPRPAARSGTPAEAQRSGGALMRGLNAARRGNLR